jgi:hypothetical protein
VEPPAADPPHVEMPQSNDPAPTPLHQLPSKKAEKPASAKLPPVTRSPVKTRSGRLSIPKRDPSFQYNGAI